MSVLYLEPLEQLFELNKEIYPILDDLSDPLIVIGGQAINYWLYYFDCINELTDIQRISAASVDIDYASSHIEFEKISKVWHVKFNKAPIDHATPEIGNFVLRDKVTNQIKKSNGALFLDIAAFEKRQISPNQVDIFHLPYGFRTIDFKATRLDQHTSHFEFPSDYNLDTHENLRVLNPIGCLKSRILNWSKLSKVKKPQFELERIKILARPCIYFIGNHLEKYGYRRSRKYIDLLMILCKQKSGINLAIEQSVFIYQLLEQITTNYSDYLPQEFIDVELPRWIEGLKEKIERLSVYTES
jgi:hypothetical protein